MSALNFDTPIQYLRGVGPVRAGLFGQIGILTVGDLLEHYPFRYDVRPRSQPIGTLRLGETSTVIGAVRQVRRSPGQTARSLVATVIDGTGQCRVRWFNSDYLAEKLTVGQNIRLTGKVEQHGHFAHFVNPHYVLFDPDSDPFEGDRESHTPVYSATAELPSSLIESCVRQSLPDLVHRIDECLPEWLRAMRKLPPRSTAVARCHHPTRAEDIPIARRRLAYDELLLPLLAVRLRRRFVIDHTHCEPIVVSPLVNQRIRARFPFTLTQGQEKCVAEIVADLGRGHPMNRLLQGDVGSGKTAVALYAALAVIAAGRQVMFLAPTEILARQHDDKVRRYLQGSRVNIGFLSGSTPATERSELLSRCSAGKLDLLIGTHALLEEDVTFQDLALSVVDEQHRFGVAQKATVRTKADRPHTLVMSATPIPRTLAMTLFGDLDISTLVELPAGRPSISTRIVSSEKEAWSLVRQRVDNGEQAFIVYPLVEESEAVDLKAATVEARRLADGPLNGMTLDLLHGRMSAPEKEAVMRRFAQGEIAVLVSTTVIEVGIDVPNATVMVVMHAERYGLTQLHQLRGRVGRGTKPSFCLLVTPIGGLERLRILTQTRDGFRIAEEDLRLRGPGDVLGTRQHGFPELKVADLSRDVDVLMQAGHDAAEIVRRDPRLTAPDHAALRRELLRRFGDALTYIDVG